MSKYEPERGKRKSNILSKFGASQAGSRPGAVDGTPAPGGTEGQPMGLLLVLTYPT
jgi:hypothetical protein